MGGGRVSLTERSRYAPAMLLAVVLAGTGAATGNPVALFAAVLPLSVVGFGALVTAPPASAVTVERRVSDHTPQPGETVTVTLRVENDSERYLPDVRVVDDVPDPVAVVDGRPRGHRTLAPGETDEISYEVRAPRGEVTFEPATVAVRSLAGTAERRTDTAGTDRLRVSVTASAMSSSDTTGLAGRIETDDAGAGIAFHSSREYRPGDPINRIDWNRYAFDRGAEYGVVPRRRRP
ncbi:MAG: conserved repeat domain protein, partial [halophilic archaeon J07HB67]